MASNQKKLAIERKRKMLDKMKKEVNVNMQDEAGDEC